MMFLTKDLVKFPALDTRGQEHDSKFSPFETIEQDSGRDLSQLFSKVLHDLYKARALSNRRSARASSSSPHCSTLSKVIK